MKRFGQKFLKCQLKKKKKAGLVSIVTKLIEPTDKLW